MSTGHGMYRGKGRRSVRLGDDNFERTVVGGIGCLAVLYILAIIALIVTAIVIGIHLAF